MGAYVSVFVRQSPVVCQGFGVYQNLMCYILKPCVVKGLQRATKMWKIVCVCVCACVHLE